VLVVPRSVKVVMISSYQHCNAYPMSTHSDTRLLLRTYTIVG